MQKKSLLMALAVPALFAACSQEEMALAPNNASGEFQGKPLEGVTIGFNQAESADTKMANDGWNLQWKKGDQVGLVWTNAYEITKQLVEGKTYDPKVFPGTASWGSNTRMTCTNPDGNIFEMQDGQVLEGQYFAYYPYQEQTYQMNGKFSVSVDREQHQGKVSTADPAANLSYVKDHMVWVSRAYQQENKPDASTMNPATFLYPLTNEQAGMSKSIDITMNRFANLLDTRIRFTESDRADVTTNPADVVIEKVVLRTIYGKDIVNDLAVSGKFDMSKLCSYVTTAPYGLVPMAGDKNRVQLALESDNGYQVGVFTPDRVNSITTFIDSPEKVDADNSQRVNFLLLPYTNGKYSTGASLQLVIYTNYGVAVVDEADWYYNTSSDGLAGLEVWGPNTQPTDALAKLEGAAESNLYKGWARRIGAHFTRWISVNVADLRWQTRCVSNQEELVEAIRQFNTTGKKNSEMTVCVDVENLELNKFDYSVNSKDEAVRTFIANGNTLVIDDRDAHYKDAEHKITWKGNSTIGAKILTDFQENVARNATLNVVADHRVNGGMVADATSTINIEPEVTLILGAESQVLNPFELNGTVNVKAGDSKLGKLLIGQSAELTNNGTIELFGKLQSNKVFTNGATGNINLYTTATIEDKASINNYGLVNYYYAKAENMKNFAVANEEEGKYLATYDRNKVPATSDAKEIAFLNEANACGVTHYVIAKALDVESQTVNMSNAESIVVNSGINITANPSSSNTWLKATKATLYFKGTHTINVKGSYASTAKFQVLNIVMAYNGNLTNNAIIEQQWNGTFRGEVDFAGNAKYTVNNNGSIYGGTLAEQTGTITWKTKKYGDK